MGRLEAAWPRGRTIGPEDCGLEVRSCTLRCVRDDVDDAHPVGAVGADAGVAGQAMRPRTGPTSGAAQTQDDEAGRQQDRGHGQHADRHTRHRQPPLPDTPDGGTLSGARAPLRVLTAASTHHDIGPRATSIVPHSAQASGRSWRRRTTPLRLVATSLNWLYRLAGNIFPTSSHHHRNHTPRALNPEAPHRPALERWKSQIEPSDAKTIHECAAPTAQRPAHPTTFPTGDTLNNASHRPPEEVLSAPNRAPATTRSENLSAHYLMMSIPSILTTSGLPSTL